MEKIAIALQRVLDAETLGEGLFDSKQIPEITSKRAPRIQYAHTRSIEIPPHALERHRVITTSNDPTADAFRLLRTQVLMQMRQNRWRTLAVTSPNKGAGKSTVALNLAIGFATELDHTALLIDADKVGVDFIGTGHRTARASDTEVRNQAQMDADRTQEAWRYTSCLNHCVLIRQCHLAATEDGAQLELVDFVIAPHQNRDQLVCVGPVDQGFDEPVGG